MSLMSDTDKQIKNHDNKTFKTYRQSFDVRFEYPVHFTHQVFDFDNPLLESVLDRLNEQKCHRCIVFIDSNVVETHPEIIKKIESYFQAREEKLELACQPCIMPADKKAGWDIVHNIVSIIKENHLDRQSFVIAVGGGSVLDIVGFACSIVHRGLRLLRLPTTTLAQADAGIGVKNGMDTSYMKNFIGTFAPPFAVINDFDFLSTLSFEDWTAGIAEAFKVAIIKDADFFDYLCANGDALRQRDISVMTETIYRCAMIHLEHIRTSGDAFEFGSARPLDFGHWAAHKIETISDYQIGHGQAVAIGIAIDSFYAMRQGLINQAQLQRITEGLIRCGLDVYNEIISKRTSAGELTILEGLRQFQEHLGGELTVTLPKNIGAKIEVNNIDSDIIEEAVQYLQGICKQGSD